MDWKNISTQDDADRLMKIFGEFHDACVREAHLWTDHWVDRDLRMACGYNLDNRIRFLIQRQFQNPSAIELLFDEVTRLNLVPSPENYDSIIFDATILVQEGTIYWSLEGGWRPDRLDRDDATWVSAKKLCWREVDWLGEELHYGPRA